MAILFMEVSICMIATKEAKLMFQCNVINVIDKCTINSNAII